MKDRKHLTFEQRKVITNGISPNYKLKEIAESLGLNPTNISKEVKRNRESITIRLNKTYCKKITRWSYYVQDVTKDITINVILQSTNMMQKKPKIKLTLI